MTAIIYSVNGDRRVFADGDTRKKIAETRPRILLYRSEIA
jgi:hypothetical protein